MANLFRKPITWIITAIVIGVIIVLIIMTVINQPRTTTPAAQDEVTSSETQPSPQFKSNPESQKTFGARHDTDRRTWPEVWGTLIDDSQYATPGKYSVDFLYSRPVFTPFNHDGDLPPAKDMVTAPDACSPEPVTLTGKTQQQYVNARFLTVNSVAGPTTMIDDVPGGYAHSPQGAIVAALNQMSYGRHHVGDEVGDAIDKKLWSTSNEVQNDPHFAVGGPMPGPWGYKILTCSPNIMIVDVGFKTLDPERIPDFATRVTLVWQDNDWAPDFSGANDADIKNPSRKINIDDYSVVNYQ